MQADPLTLSLKNLKSDNSKASTQLSGSSLMTQSGGIKFKNMPSQGSLIAPNINMLDPLTRAALPVVGYLSLTIVQAEIIRDPTYFGLRKPYVRINVGNESYKT